MKYLKAYLFSPGNEFNMLNYQRLLIAYLCAVTRRLKRSNFKEEGFICPTVSESTVQHVQERMVVGQQDWNSS